MAKQALPLLTGGLNQVTRNDLIDDTELTESDNYDIKGDGRLVKRKKSSSVDYDIANSDSLATFQETIGPAYAWRIEAWSPNFMIDMNAHPEAEGMLAGVPAIVAVNTDFDAQGIERLRVDLWYRYFKYAVDGETITYHWTNEVQWGAGGSGTTIFELLEAEGIFYELGVSDIRMDIAEDKIVIVDGRNQVHYITIDSDGIPQVGILGFDAPKNKLRFLDRFMDTTDDDDVGLIDDDLFTDDDTDMFTAPGFLQATYTVVDKYGNESNPAPYSDTLHMDYFNLDSGFTDTQWLEGIKVTDLSIPITSEIVAEEIEEFKIYFRWIRYKESNVGDLIFQWTQTEKIIAKVGYGETGNTYTMQMPPSVEQVSYENDPSPRARQIATMNGITMIGDITQKPTFPWDFKYQHAIDIKNTTGTHYVDAVVRIRLTQPFAYAPEEVTPGYCNEIDKLDLFDYFYYYKQTPASPNNETDLVQQAIRQHRNYFRFFDIDQTTPLQGITMDPMKQGDSNDPLSPHTVDIYLKIPLLPAMNTHRIYLCWTPIGGEDVLNPNPEAPINFFKGVQYPYDNYDFGYYDVNNNEVAVEYWDHCDIYYGGIYSAQNILSGTYPEESVFFAQLNFKHQRVFQSRGVLSEDAIVVAPGDCNYSTASMANRANRLKEGAFTSGDGQLLIGEETNARIALIAAMNDASAVDNNNRLLGYGSYKTLTENVGATLTFDNTDGPGLYNKNFTVMMNMKNLSPGISGDPSSGINTLVTIRGESVFSREGGIGFGFISQGNSSWNMTDSEVFRLTIGDSSEAYQYFIHKRGAFTSSDVVSAPSFPEDGDDAISPFAEWNQKEAENPCDWTYGTKYIGLSVEKYLEGSVDHMITLWIYDISSNNFSFIEFPVTDPASSFSNGFTKLQILGADVQSIDGVGFQRANMVGSQIIFEKDRYYDGTRSDDVNAMWHRLSGMPGYKDPVGYYYKGWDESERLEEEHNVGIVFSKTREVFKNRQRSLLKWSAINNFSFPTLNVARLKEPIIAIIPAPSFLRFKYANTFLVFSRNRIERVQVYPDVGTVSDEQSAEFVFQNVIAEKKNYGLLARDSLTLAGQSLYWLSEVGLVEWNSEGMKVISKNKINPELLPQAYGFVNPVGNQYIVGIPSDYLIDNWSPGEDPSWNPAYHGNLQCHRCCLPPYWEGQIHWGHYSEETCTKNMGGVYLNRQCHSNNPPWWQTPTEWEYTPCCDHSLNQIDGFDADTWCSNQVFPEGTEEDPNVPDDEGPDPDAPTGPCPERSPCIYDAYVGPDEDQGMETQLCGSVCRMSNGWPFSRYSEYGANQWGADAHNGYVFMNFLELDEPQPTGTGTIKMYSSNGNDANSIGCSALMNIYYPTPDHITEGEGCRKVILNGKDLITRFGSVIKDSTDPGWHENFQPYKCDDSDGYRTWNLSLHHFGGGMAMRVRDCPIFDTHGDFLAWDSPKRYHSSLEVFSTEYGEAESGYVDMDGFWWADNYLSSWSSLIPFPLEESPYWGTDNRGFRKHRNPFRRAINVTRGSANDRSNLWSTYYLDNRKFGFYSQFSVIWATIGKKISGEIVNWVVDESGYIQEWPGSEYADSAAIRTKRFFIESGSIKKVKIDYGGASEVGVVVGTRNYKNINFTSEDTENGTTIQPNHYNPQDKYSTTNQFSINNIQSKQWRGLAINKCTEFDLTISGADTINSVFYDVTLDAEIKSPAQPTVTYEKKGYLDPVGSSSDKE